MKVEANPSLGRENQFGIACRANRRQNSYFFIQLKIGSSKAVDPNVSLARRQHSQLEKAVRLKIKNNNRSKPIADWQNFYCLQQELPGKKEWPSEQG